MMSCYILNLKSGIITELFAIFRYLHSSTGIICIIGINNSVLYIDYFQKVKNKVIPYCGFSHPSSNTCTI